MLAHQLQADVLFKCSVCNSMFPSLEGAYQCCKRAKAQILFSKLRGSYKNDLDRQCNLIKSSVLGRR
jgi:hypothetical protein